MVREGRFRFSVDRGGTFTDIFAEVPGGFRVMKLLSEDPSYEDAPREGIRRILEMETGIPHPIGHPIDTSRIECIRMGTTVATNALLERKGSRMALATTSGFPDLLYIGDQSRPEIFALEVRKADLLYERVIEVGERVRLMRNDEDESKVRGRIVSGVSGEKLEVMTEPDLDNVKIQLQELLNDGIRSLAVALLHSYTFPDHEIAVGELAKKMGFEQVSLSSQLMAMVKIVPRSFTACADAYLTPCISLYLHRFCAGFDINFLDNVKLTFMQSDGGLASLEDFSGFRAILSGPAGGVVGFARTAYDEITRRPVCGFDMGGTSTDVSRYDGTLEHIFENVTAGVTIQAPQLDINTVAAGGGSRLFFRSGMFVVGPESAGAYPGPACYRNGGPLAITDANLILGRIQPEQFPAIFGPKKNEQVSVEATRTAFESLAKQINAFFEAHPKSLGGNGLMSVEEIALGYIEVANEAMCRPIRALTQARGFDITEHVLACFGGAGGQHCCAIARNLGIKDVFVHRFSGILSAYGMGLADVVHESQEPCRCLLQGSDALVADRVQQLSGAVVEHLRKQGFADDSISTTPYLNLRYEGTDHAIMTAPETGLSGFLDNFCKQYLREYGFTLDRPLVIDDIRVRGVARTPDIAPITIGPSKGTPKPVRSVVCYFDCGPRDTAMFRLGDLGAGDRIQGPSIIIDATSTIVIDPDCTANITTSGDIRIEVGSSVGRVASPSYCDPVLLSIFGHRFMSIAEQMGRTLQRTSISTNIKERLDFSCAIFGPDGGLVANAPHLPVHLGAMQEAVRFQIRHLGDDWNDGDVVLSNHPRAGGSHLPDITVMAPVFNEAYDKPIFFVASRGHHADIGGISPGSMPPFSKTLSQEGAAIVSFKLVQGGVFNEDGVSALLLRTGEHSVIDSCIGTRNLSDNLSDLKAQVAANHKGIGLISELIEEYNLEVVHAYMDFIRDNAELAVREMLQEISVKRGLKEVDTLSATDYMDDGSVIRLRITIDRRDGSALFDFTGTGTELYGNCNAPPSVTYSAIIYCLRCLVKRDTPLNQGCLEPLTVNIPEGSLLCPSETAAVVGGNVLTSQRITDVILRAFGACAASQGCMNNLTFGNDTFGYYETIAGGNGAGPTWHGRSGVHTHMTNTRITDPEILERRYPVLLRRFCLRRGSGGAGRFKGGDGVIREIEFLEPLDVGILSERRAFAPYGMDGGEDGERGRNEVVKHDGRVLHLSGKDTFRAEPGDCIRVLSPGGGGYGAVGTSPTEEELEVTSAPMRFGGSIGRYRRLQESA